MTVVPPAGAADGSLTVKARSLPSAAVARDTVTSPSTVNSRDTAYSGRDSLGSSPWQAGSSASEPPKVLWVPSGVLLPVALRSSVEPR